MKLEDAAGMLAREMGGKVFCAPEKDTQRSRPVSEFYPAHNLLLLQRPGALLGILRENLNPDGSQRSIEFRELPFELEGRTLCIAANPDGSYSRIDTYEGAFLGIPQRPNS